MNIFIKLMVFLLVCGGVFAKDLPTSYFVNGKTHQSFDKQINIINSNTTPISLYFIGNVGVSINESSEFLINQTYINYTPTNSPSVIKPININYTLSVMNGNVDIINGNTNIENSVVIHTPRVNIILNEGKFKFIVNESTTIIAVIKGSVSVLNVIEDKHYKLTEGNCGVITKHIPLSTKDANFYSATKSTITTYPIKPDDKDELTAVLNTLSKTLHNVIFVSINNEIFGVFNDNP